MPSIKQDSTKERGQWLMINGSPSVDNRIPGREKSAHVGSEGAKL